MAHIDIQKKQSHGWIWLALGALVLALLLWWLLAGSDRGQVVENEVPDPIAAAPGVATSRTEAEGGVITDLGTILSRDDGASLMGRRVALTDVPVADVVSDNGFWIGSGTEVGQGVFAVRTNTAQPSTPPDGAVNEGQQVTVHGIITAMPSDLNRQTVTWNLRSTDQEVLAKHRVYIHVDSVRIGS